MQHLYDFFRNADSVHVVNSCTGSRQSHATKYYTLVAFLQAKFFINGAIKSATLSAYAAFASVNSSSRPIVRPRTQLSLTNCAMLLQHNLELTMTAIKTGAVGINQGH